jgi:zinc transporter ZupT
LTYFAISASVVFIDKFSRKSLLDSRPFMASSMALASGVLLFSSLAILFPQAQKRLGSDALLYSCFFGGASFTLVLTRVIHYLMPDAIHACGDASESCHRANDTHNHNDHDHDHHHQHNHHPPTEEERRKLNERPCDVEYGTIPSSERHFRFHHDDLVHGTNNENTEDAEIVSLCPSTQHHMHHETVEQTVENDPGHYYSIGLQTAVAICVHKFPGKITIDS